jgi:hypothetical protein
MDCEQFKQFIINIIAENIPSDWLLLNASEYGELVKRYLDSDFETADLLAKCELIENVYDHLLPDFDQTPFDIDDVLPSVVDKLDEQEELLQSCEA